MVVSLSMFYLDILIKTHPIKSKINSALVQSFANSKEPLHHHSNCPVKCLAKCLSGETQYLSPNLTQNVRVIVLCNVYN